MLELYSYYRSTAAYRVRIALNIKAVDYDVIPVHLVKGGGEQLKPEYLALNPQGLVPTLRDGQGVLNQSLAILEYLEECYPTPALLPNTPLLRAQTRALAYHIACEIHPLNNLRVLNYLTGELAQSEAVKKQWYHHWLQQGFGALETRLGLTRGLGPYACGAEPSFADLCLVPQLYNALRFDFSLENYPLIAEVNAACLALAPFEKAKPENQVDAPE